MQTDASSNTTVLCFACHQHMWEWPSLSFVDCSLRVHAAGTRGMQNAVASFTQWDRARCSACLAYVTHFPHACLSSVCLRSVSAADTSSSKPPGDSTSAADEAAVDSADPWGFPALAAAAPAAADATAPPAAAAGAGDEAAAMTAAVQRSSSPEGLEQITLAAPVSPVESPFLAGAALASCSKNSSPAGNALSRGGSRADSSSSAAARTAAAGNSSSSSSRRLSAAGRQQQQQLVSTSSSGGARSPLGDTAQQGPSTSGASGAGIVQQRQSAGFDTLDSALLPPLDADAESTGGQECWQQCCADLRVAEEACCLCCAAASLPCMQSLKGCAVVLCLLITQ